MNSSLNLASENNKVAESASTLNLISENNSNNHNKTKLINSINLLKNIIGNLNSNLLNYHPKYSSSSSSSSNRLLQNEKNANFSSESQHSDPIGKLYALAQNSVTLSFRDYISLQKSSRDFLSTSTTSYMNSLLSKSNNTNTNTQNLLSGYNNLLTTPSSKTVAFNMLETTLNRSFSTPINGSSSIISSIFNGSSSFFVSSSSDLLSSSISTSSINRSSSTDSSPSSLLIYMALFYSILILTSVISNPLLLYILLWRRKAQIKLIDIFVANLSLSDLFLTVLNIPICLILFFSEQWPFGSLLCQLGTFSTSCSIYVNIFTMAYISIDRYFAVTRPLLVSNPRKQSVLLDNHTRNKIYMVLTLIWIISALLSIPQILFSKVSTGGNSGSSNSTTASSSLSANSLLFGDSSDEDSGTNFTSSITSDFERDMQDTYGSGSGMSGEDDPFKRCIIEYPHPSMKNYMVLSNFSLQYLIPSILILYFYGKIIYHLYLNLNIEDLMEHTPTTSTQNATASATYNKKQHRFIFKSRTKYDNGSSSSNKVNALLNLEDRNSLLLQNNNNNKKKDSIITSATLELYEASAMVTRKSSGKRMSIPNSFSHMCQTEHSDSTLNASAITMTHATPTRKPSKSRMRVEGYNRTRNLKKSIKVMIIIIVLFLLSWLPIHMYRLVTTFYPVVKRLWEEFSYNPTQSADSTRELLISLMNNKINGSSESSTTANNINNNDICATFHALTTQAYKDCVIKRLLGSGSNSENGSSSEYYPNTTSSDYEINTLHNRYVFFVCYFMAMSSVCYNPIVYFWMHKKFRAEVKILFVNIVNFFKCQNAKTKTNNANNNNNSKNLVKNGNHFKGGCGGGSRSGTFTTTSNSLTAKNASILRPAFNNSSNLSILKNGSNMMSVSNQRLSNLGRPSIVSNQSAASSPVTNTVTATGYRSCYLKNESSAKMEVNKSLQVNRCIKLATEDTTVRNKRFSSLTSDSTLSSSK